MATSLSGPGAACVHGAALIGIDAQIIQVQATIGTGAPGFAILGVPGDSTREIRDRVRAAVLNSGLTWPSGGITVGLGPAALFRRGCGLDLPIAVAILAAAAPSRPVLPPGGSLPPNLAWTGACARCTAIVPVLAAAAERGRPVTAVVAPGNEPEAALLPGITVAPHESLRQVASWLRGEQMPAVPAGPAGRDGPAGPDRPGLPGLSALGVSPGLRQALEVSAAGGHHLCLTVPRGIGVPALAAGLAALLPDLTEREAAEATVIHSVAGLLAAGWPRITRPPLRVPQLQVHDGGDDRRWHRSAAG